MSQKSQIYLNGLSGLAHTYIDANGKLCSGSYNPIVLVEGPIEEKENVVIDFGTISEWVKSKIASYDHKLWLFADSICSIEDVEFIPFNGDAYDTILVNSSDVNFWLDGKSIVNFDGKCDELTISETIGQHLTEISKEILEGLNFKVILRKQPLLFDNDLPYSMFSYSHGLKNSTCTKCQLLAHGHLSYIQVDANSYKETCKHVLDKITKDLDGCVFVWGDNVTKITDKYLTIEYVSKDRGYFSAEYNTDVIKVIVLETETTVEHIVEYIAKTYEKELRQIEASLLVVSEGLFKGAVKYIVE
jgi:6-pyruvoyl-tetrahydropterin synthase